MKAFKHYIIAVLLLSVIFSCQEIIDLDLSQERPRVVIEGIISDEAGAQKIKVSRSLNYYDAGTLPPIEDATVTVLDSADNLLQQFAYSSEDSTYKSEADFVAEIGKTYSVEVQADGSLYRATGTILQNAQLDSLYALSEAELEALGQNVFGDGEFYLFVDGVLIDPEPNELQYFLLETFVNDTLRDSRGDVASSIFSSEFFGSEFNFLPVPGSFNGEDSVRLKLYSLSEEVFQYYNEFINLLFNDGGVFSPPPVNPQTNIINITDAEDYALGYIQFSAMREASIVLPPADD